MRQYRQAHLVEVYRKTLLKSAAGELRHIIADTLPRAMTENVLLNDPKTNVDHIQWWDGMYFPRVPRQEAAFYKSEMKAYALDKELCKDIEAIAKLIGKSQVSKLATARYALGEGPHVASEVDDAGNVLLQVRSYFNYICIFLYT